MTATISALLPAGTPKRPNNVQTRVNTSELEEEPKLQKLQANVSRRAHRKPSAAPVKTTVQGLNPLTKLTPNSTAMPRPKKTAEPKVVPVPQQQPQLHHHQMHQQPIAAIPTPMMPVPLPQAVAPHNVIPQRVVDNDSFLRVRDSVSSMTSSQEHHSYTWQFPKPVDPGTRSSRLTR